MRAASGGDNQREILKSASIYCLSGDCLKCMLPLLCHRQAVECGELENLASEKLLQIFPSRVGGDQKQSCKKQNRNECEWL